MQYFFTFIAIVASVFTVLISALNTNSTSLASVCTISYVKASLPANNFVTGITIDPTSITATVVYNSSVSSVSFPSAVIQYCNVTFAYSHSGLNDRVHVQYWMPAPSSFSKRYLSTGGGGFAINSARMSLPGGIIYGAVAGATDGGFGNFSTNFDAVFPLANGTPNYEGLYMFGYKAHYELSALGKEFTKHFYDMGSAKLYSYYQGCSEGGREGFSQVQRYGDEWDGAVIGAPAFRFSFQQVQHLYSNVVEQTLNYYPPPCELAQIVNATIAFCDPLDGLSDGVVSRTDLCKLHFNLNTTLGMPYYCAATTGGGGFPPMSKRQFPSPAAPEQRGTVTAQGIAVASKILEGLRDSEGRQAYLSYQPAAAFDDAGTAYNAVTGKWELSINGMGAEWVSRFLYLLNSSSLPSLNNVSYDALKEWMIQGLEMYSDTLQTTWPDLTPFHKGGGKILHYHGESDASIPTASSVRYYESVRKIMHSNMSFDASNAAMSEWYKLYLIPGAGHCSPNSLQPNAAFPQTNLAVMIDWVENGHAPTTLNVTHLAGNKLGQKAQICAWPSRPLYKVDGVLECVFDQASYESWIYDFDGVPVPVY